MKKSKDYTAAKLTIEEVIEEFGLTIYNFPLKKRGATKDDCGEFYLYIYHRLEKLIRNYEPLKGEFKHYLLSVLKWHFQSYKNIKGRKNYLEKMREDADPMILDSLAAPESPPEEESRSLPLLTREGTFKHESDGLNFQLFCLKGAYYLNEGDLDFIHRLTGTDRQMLKKQVLLLKKECKKKVDQLNIYRYNRNLTFAAIMLMEKELKTKTYRCTREEHTMLLEGKRKKLSQILKRMSRMKRFLSTRTVARVTGMPKGTIDSAIYRFKKRMAACTRKNLN